MARRAVVLLLIAAVAAAGGYAWMRRSAPVRRFASSPIASGAFSADTVTIPVRRATITRTISAAGHIDAVRRKELTSSIGGRVVEVPVDVGDRVEAGALVARLDETPARLKVLQAQREYDQARLESTAAVAEEKRLALELALKDLEAIEVKAPFAGIVAELAVEPGDRIGEQSVIAQLIDVERYTVTVNVDETDLSWVKPGQTVVATFDSIPDLRIAGRVTRIGWLPNSTADVVVYPVEIALDPSDAPLRPGLSADVEIVIEEARDVLAVPLEAVVEGGGRSLVTRVNPDGSTQVTPVETGLTDGRMVEIRSGLSEGDRIVMNNFRLYQELFAEEAPASGFSPGARFPGGGAGALRGGGAFQGPRAGIVIRGGNAP